MLKWFKASEAAQVGTALADDVMLQSPLGSLARDKGKNPGVQERELQKFLQKFLQRVDRDARPLQLNFLRRAKLANSFKWRLLEKGIEKELVDELTQALVLRLTTQPAGTTQAIQPDVVPTQRNLPRTVEALLAKGNEYMAKGANDEAMGCYQQVVNLDPRHAVARNNLGATFSEQGRYREAEEQFRRAIGIRESYPDPHSNLGAVLMWLGRYDESETQLRRALKLKPSLLGAQLNLGTTLFLLGRLRDARESFEKAARLAPGDARPLAGLGQIAGSEGRLVEAETLFQRALNIDPRLPTAWSGLTASRRMTTADSAWFKRAEEIADSGFTPVEEATMRYAIGKYYDDVGDFARAFRSYQRGNELEKKRTQPYDRAERTRFVDDLLTLYTPEVLARAPAGSSDSARPVFVVGMPRSGTSLVEQIIASHPAAHGAGEIAFWNRAVRMHENVLRKGLPDESLCRQLAAEYLRVLAGHSEQALRVVDKAPVNCDYLGLIHYVFPNARLIYMRRDPIDTCLSCYFQQFSAAINFTMDLADLAHYYRVHERLVAHWRSVLPSEVFLDVPYAELVADQESWSRKIVDFIRLPWDARCLEFHKTERTVTTASVWQVRQKIYSSSVGRWRNYQKFIGPLLSLSHADS
jgi:tetratricopeptide (TPR) repeat protein